MTRQMLAGLVTVFVVVYQLRMGEERLNESILVAESGEPVVAGDSGVNFHLYDSALVEEELHSVKQGDDTAEEDKDYVSALQSELSRAQSQIQALTSELSTARLEIKDLSRQMYLCKLRSRPVEGSLGEWNAKQWNEKELSQGGLIGRIWKNCYPSKLKAAYCMQGYKENMAVGPGDFCKDIGDYKWQPPANPLHKIEDKSPAAAVQLGDQIPVTQPMGPPFVEGQMPNGLYKIMKMAPGANVVWDKLTMDTLKTMLRKGVDVSPIGYPEAMKDMQAALMQIHNLQNKHVLVLGSISPWLESIVLHAGAKSVTTTDYNLPLVADDLKESEKKLHFLHLPSLLQDSQAEAYDVVLSYSSLEHDGLGRYGDPLNADADLAAMAEAFLLLKPGGDFIVGVPTDKNDAMSYYSQRDYGPKRLPLLTRGWNYRGNVNNGKILQNVTLHHVDPQGVGIHGVFLLSKPSSAPKFLEELYDAEECALTCDTESNCGPKGKGCTK